MAKRVSKIGIAIIKIGITILVKVVALNPSKAITPTIKPKKSLPQLPI